MSKFKVGDRVRLTNYCKMVYDHSAENPYDQIGVVFKVFVNGVIKVQWDQTCNNYIEDALELVEEDTSGVFGQTSFKGFKSIVIGTTVYYFASEEHREEVLKDFTSTKCLRMASIVIDKKTNAIVKMRYDLKQLFDEVLK